MSLAIATRGYVVGAAGVGLPELTQVWPDVITVVQDSQFELLVVFSRAVTQNEIVTLSSDDLDVATVPASATVLDGDVAVEFTVTSKAPGTAQITAIHDAINATSDIVVTAKSLEYRPQVLEIVNLRPAVTSAQNLKPKIYDTEES